MLSECAALASLRCRDCWHGPFTLAVHPELASPDGFNRNSHVRDRWTEVSLVEHREALPPGWQREWRGVFERSKRTLECLEV